MTWTRGFRTRPGWRRLGLGRLAGWMLGWGVAGAPAAELPIVTNGVVVIAHRGDHTRAHENTLRAFESAIAAGADFVELDVRRTRDGRHVLSHDATVDRMTDGHGRVSGLAFAEIRALRVIDRRRPELAADRIPTLEEALRACRGRIHIYLDFKEGDPGEVARLIREAGMARQVLVYCGADEMPVWRAAAPELPLIVSPPGRVAGQAEGLAAWVREHRPEVLDGPWTGYTVASVQAAMAAGAAVWPDIQGPGEGPDLWEKVVSVGFGGVQTDAPGALVRWMTARKRR